MNVKWDIRFLELAKEIATWSKDPSTQVGAVIVRPDKTIASLGYNGFPRDMNDNPGQPYERQEKLSRTIHAEMNAILNAREPVKGYWCYATFLPCDRCFVHLAQAGIVRFIAPQPSLEQTSRWGAAFACTRSYAAEMGLELVEYDMDKFKEIMELL